MANYSPLTKILMDDSRNSKNHSKSSYPFNQNSWIFQSKDAKKEPPKENAKKSGGLIKVINNYEIECNYRINTENYYRNIPIYHYRGKLNI
jgi:hypothetical protein